MKIALAMVLLASVGLSNVSGSTSALADDYESYRQNADRPNCRVVETRTTNRWGVDENVRVRVCD